MRKEISCTCTAASMLQNAFKGGRCSEVWNEVKGWAVLWTLLRWCKVFEDNAAYLISELDLLCMLCVLGVRSVLCVQCVRCVIYVLSVHAVRAV